MKTRIVTAILIILVCILPVALGGIPLEILALLILTGSLYEWLCPQAEFRKWPLFVPVSLLFRNRTSLRFGSFAWCIFGDCLSFWNLIRLVMRLSLFHSL